MKQLELNHIAPYLPYGLKCQIDLGQNEIIVTENWGLKTGSDYPASYYNEGKRYGLMLSQIKPLLRHLSDLYKEIEGVVGIVDLAKIAFPNYEWVLRSDRAVRLDAQTEYFEYDGDFLAGDGWDYYQIPNQLDLFTYLFQYHYDIFGLIDKGLAIDLNSISHE